MKLATEWKALILKNNESVLDGMIEAYKDSIGTEHSSNVQTVIIYGDGEVLSYDVMQNTTNVSVFNGCARELARFDTTNIWDCEERKNEGQKAEIMQSYRDEYEEIVQNKWDEMIERLDYDIQNEREVE